ncbi:MAG: phage holin family protein [Thermotogae bacterium]|nr:phage holin family protein [Thermotogota bacterium]
MRKRFFVTVLISAASLIVADVLIKGFEISNWVTLLIAAVVLGLLHLFVRPILAFLTLPINLLTLGLWNIALNGILFFVAINLVSQIEVEDLSSGLLAWITYNVISFILGKLIR